MTSPADATQLRRVPFAHGPSLTLIRPYLVACILLQGCSNGDGDVLQVHPVGDSSAVTLASSAGSADTMAASRLARRLRHADTIVALTVDDQSEISRFEDAIVVPSGLLLLDDRRNQLVLIGMDGTVLKRFTSDRSVTNRLRDLRRLFLTEKGPWLLTGPDQLHELRIDAETGVSVVKSYELGRQPLDLCVGDRGAVIYRPTSDDHPVLSLVSLGDSLHRPFGRRYTAGGQIVRLILAESRVACKAGDVASAWAVTGDVFAYDSLLAISRHFRLPGFVPVEVLERRNGSAESRPRPTGYHRVEGLDFAGAALALVQVGEYSTRIDTITGLNGRDRVRLLLLNLRSGEVSLVRTQEERILAFDDDNIVLVHDRHPSRLTWLRLRN